MAGRPHREPGFWQRPLSTRAQVILFVVVGAIVVGGLAYAIATGMRLF